jgi:hypothetical protein
MGGWAGARRSGSAGASGAPPSAARGCGARSRQGPQCSSHGYAAAGWTAAAAISSSQCSAALGLAVVPAAGTWRPRFETAMSWS